LLLYNVASRLSGFQLSVEAKGLQFGRRIIPFIAWMFAWPSWLLVRFVVAPAAASGMRKSEYDADAAAERIGRGPALIRALDKLSAWERARTGWEAALYRNHPPTPLRIERLEPRQPGDHEYQEPELGVDRQAAANWLVSAALVVSLVFVAVIAVGYFVNVYNTHRQTTGSAGIANAETTVANYTTAYLNNLAADPYQYNAVIAQFADPSLVSTLQTEADTANSNGTPFGAIDSSQATTVGCKYYSNPPSVDVRVAWTYGMLTAPNQEVWFTDNIPLTVVDGSWKTTVVPSLPNNNTPGSDSSQRPAGFTNCE